MRGKLNNIQLSNKCFFSRYSAEVKKYDEAKAEAEDNLSKAEESLRGRQKTKAMEIARLTAMLRKAEMNVSSLESEINQKVFMKTVNTDNFDYDIL